MMINMQRKEEASPLIEEAEVLRQGEYNAILSLLRLLEHGREVKREVDLVIDKCGEKQNLRNVIFEMK